MLGVSDSIPGLEITFVPELYYSEIRGLKIGGLFFIHYFSKDTFFSSDLTSKLYNIIKINGTVRNVR